MVTQKGHLVQKIPKLRATFETKNKNNFSSESLEVYQLCEVSRCVTQKLLRIAPYEIRRRTFLKVYVSPRDDCNLPVGPVPRPCSYYSEKVFCLIAMVNNGLLDAALDVVIFDG